jgi:hypothetical protein
MYLKLIGSRFVNDSFPFRFSFFFIHRYVNLIVTLLSYLIENHIFQKSSLRRFAPSPLNLWTDINLRSDSSCPFCEIVRGENFENYQDAIEDLKATSEGFHSHIIVRVLIQFLENKGNKNNFLITPQTSLRYE